MANYAERAVTLSWPGAVGAPGSGRLVRKYYRGQWLISALNRRLNETGTLETVRGPGLRRALGGLFLELGRYALAPSRVPRLRT